MRKWVWAGGLQTHNKILLRAKNKNLKEFDGRAIEWRMLLRENNCGASPKLLPFPRLHLFFFTPILAEKSNHTPSMESPVALSKRGRPFCPSSQNLLRTMLPLKEGFRCNRHHGPFAIARFDWWVNNVLVYASSPSLSLSPSKVD